MGTETVEALVDGGKASAAPPLGSSLGPLKVNIGQVISSINEKTKIFNGMKVPVKVIVNTETKDFEIEVGTPPASQLVKKEINIESGSGEPNKNKAGAITFEGIIKVTKMKRDSLLAREFKSAVKNIVGSCNSLGALVEGKIGAEFNKDIEAGLYTHQINSKIIEISEDKKAKLKQQLDEINKEIKRELEKEKALAEKVAEKKEVKEETVVAKEGEGAPVATIGKAPVGKAEAGKEATAAPAAGKAPAKAPAKEEKKGKK